MINHTKDELKSILLSLNLLNKNDSKLYLKTLYSISNRIERNYKVYKRKAFTALYLIIGIYFLISTAVGIF